MTKNLTDLEMYEKTVGGGAKVLTLVTMEMNKGICRTKAKCVIHKYRSL